MSLVSSSYTVICRLIYYFKIEDTFYVALRGDCKPYPHNVNFRTFFPETNKHRTMKLYIATFPLSMHTLCFFVNIGENLVPFMGINILINVKKIDS